VRARQPMFASRQLMTELAKQHELEAAHAVVSCHWSPTATRHTSAVAPAALSTVVRAVMCQPPNSSARAGVRRP
jgi:hypothetical protein